MKLTVISPVYKAEEIISELVTRIEDSASKITSDFEIILIDDCSPDGSWKVITDICKKNSKVKGIKFSKNFGQHYAITAGLKESKGDYIIIIDCDLQDDPSYIPEMYKKLLEDCDIVVARMQQRTHSFIRNFYSALFALVFNSLAENNFSSASFGTFSIIKRKVADAFCKVNDTDRHYLLVLRWLGFKWKHIDVVQSKRFSGSSSYSFNKLCKHTLSGIVSQSDKLLKFSIWLGLIFAVIALIALISLIVMYFITGFKEGWVSLICLILLATGLTLISNGVLGIYLAKTYEQAKNRPLYIIDERVNFKNE